MKVLRGSGSLKKLSGMTEKLGIRHPVVVGMEPLTGRLLNEGFNKHTAFALLRQLQGLQIVHRFIRLFHA